MESPLTKMDEKNAQNLGNSQGIMAWLKRSPASPLPMRLPTARPSAMVSPPVQVVKLFGFIFLVQQKMMTGTFLLQHKKNGGWCIFVFLHKKALNPSQRCSKSLRIANFCTDFCWETPWNAWYFGSCAVTWSFAQKRKSRCGSLRVLATQNKQDINTDYFFIRYVFNRCWFVVELDNVEDLP